MKRVLLLMLMLFFQFIAEAHSFQYQPDKPGKLIFDNRLDKCTGVDVPTVQNKLTSIVEWVRRNDSVIDHPIGFDAMVRLSGTYCDKKNRQEDFGMRSIIGFSFNHF